MFIVINNNFDFLNKKMLYIKNFIKKNINSIPLYLNYNYENYM